MPSFFTVPTSQRKRKRAEGKTTSSNKKRNTDSRATAKSSSAKPNGKRDESISGSDSDENEDNAGVSSDNLDGQGSSDSDHEDETGAERRLRLAERYLENIKDEVGAVGFDAAEIDRDRIAERLKEDVSEGKGKLYRRIASDYTFNKATKCQFRINTQSTTSVAACPPYVYTVSKDLTLTKWEIPSPPKPPLDASRKSIKKSKKPPPPARRRPLKLLYTRGNVHKSTDSSYQHHTSSILCVAASSDNRFVATGSADKKLIIWATDTLTPLRVFTQHRDAITSLAFRRGTNQLYSASKDRTIKTWSLNELAYVETLFGHQDGVVDVTALAQEHCLSVGARDRTVRLWKVVEETQLVFRGGGGGSSSEKRSRHKDLSNPSTISKYYEGSIDRVAYIDEETFVTGSDSGGLSLWSIHKKKPVFTVPLAHGLNPPLRADETSAETDLSAGKVIIPTRQPRWITALATVPYSDLVVSGSWDGWVRVWRISPDKKRIESVGTVGNVDGSPASPAGVEDGVRVGEATNLDRHIGNGLDSTDAVEEDIQLVPGFINDIAVFERGDQGRDGLCIVAGVGSEHRLGRWKTLKARNGAVLFEVHKIGAEEKSVKADQGTEAST